MQNPTRHNETSVQLDLFCSGLPRRPYAVDQLGHRLLITSAPRAMRQRYIQVNPPWMRVFLVFDVDRQEAALAWEDADLPPPLWTAVNRENGHAHSGWALDAPVLLGSVPVGGEILRQECGRLERPRILPTMEHPSTSVTS